MIAHAGQPRFAAVCFDVDSTVAAIEGIDWLAAQRGPTVEQQCVALTARAMDGEIPLDAVYLERLRAIQPTANDLQQLGDVYRSAMEPGADALMRDLQAAGVVVHWISGGLRDAILPLAVRCGVPAAQVHAVELLPDATGALVRLNGEQPLATQFGKRTILTGLNLPAPRAMVGDGATDAATHDLVDAFIAYTGVAHRAAVVALAQARAGTMAELRALLFTPAD